jgi:hypothetical protein
LANEEFRAAITRPYGRFDYGPRFKKDRPLLAHYTTIKGAEAIIANNQLWFSNPLFMNDIDELTFGVDAANKVISSAFEVTKPFADKDIEAAFFNAYRTYDRVFAEDLALDVYVFCLSQHDPKDFDGTLSMWRGYGALGDGVAIVFDTGPLVDSEDPAAASVLFAAPIFYGDEQQRMALMVGLVQEFIDILKAHPPTKDVVHEAAFHLHHCVVVQSLLMKHLCFQEEREWRLIYMKHVDDEAELHDDIGYHIGEDGFAQPKFKFRVRPVKGMGRDTLDLRDVIERFIVGPAVAGPASLATFRRIVEQRLGPEFAKKVVGSTIPFRPRVSRD